MRVVKLIIVGMMCVLTSCHEENVNLDHSSVKLKGEKNYKKEIDYLTSLGFDKSSISVKNDVISVGDIGFPLENFWKRYGSKKSNNKIAMRSSGSNYVLIPGGKVTKMSKIRINISPREGFTKNWINAFTVAVERWNDLSLSISFYLTFNHVGLRRGEGINVYYRNFENEGIPNNFAGYVPYAPYGGYATNLIYQ